MLSRCFFAIGRTEPKKGMFIIMRKIAFILISIMVLTTVFTACADRGNGKENTDIHKGSVFDSLPDIDFDGQSVDFLANVL